MSSIKIIPIKRYAVTRKGYSDKSQVETVADDLTLAQAQDIAHAMQAREHHAGMASSLIDESEAPKYEMGDGPLSDEFIARIQRAADESEGE